MAHPKELTVIFKPIPLSPLEEQKRMDEVLEILYELYCQYQLSKSVRKSNNEIYNSLPKEEVL